MGRACNTYGEKGGAYRVLVGKHGGKGATWKTQAYDGRIILKLIFKKWDGGMDWIDMAQDRDRDKSGALVNAVINLQVP